MVKISTKTARRKLKQRREPYWNTITQKQSVGYRKGKSDPGTWIAKRTLPDGNPKAPYETQFDPVSAA